MINHTPVLVSRQSGVAEVVRNVLKADFWDTEEMANKILSVLEYDSLHRHLQVEGRKEVEGVSWAKAAEKCMDLYQRLCAIPA
jgi:glycosyltransferase involved in cell wall biosynthesis